MQSKLLPYGRQSIDQNDIDAVVAQLHDNWLTQGPTVARFEEALCQITGAKYAVAVANGTAALHLASLASQISAGHRCLVPTVTFVATANAVRYAGGEPVFLDIDPDTGLLDMGAFEANLRRGPAPRAILPVSFAGSVPDLPAIRKLADKLGCVVIEDAAHSLGATYESAGETFRSASCAHTTLATLSFHPVKHLTTGEGGAVTTNDERLYRLLSELRTHGITKDPARLEANDGPWYYEQQALGFNYRITDFQCALGISQAKKFPQFLERRRHIAACYNVAFQESRALRSLKVPSGVTSAYHLYVVRLLRRPGESLASLAARRKAFFLGLRERDVAAQVHYIPVHRQPDFIRNGFAAGNFPGADEYYAGCLSLPIFPGMSDDDAQRVIETVHWASGIE